MSLFGKWGIVVSTPFGNEDFVMELFEDLSGVLSHYKGFINFENAKVSNDGKELNIFANTDIPISTTVSINAQSDNFVNMNGVVQIGEYALCNFSARKEQ